MYSRTVALVSRVSVMSSVSRTLINDMWDDEFLTRANSRNATAVTILLCLALYDLMCSDQV